MDQCPFAHNYVDQLVVRFQGLQVRYLFSKIKKALKRRGLNRIIIYVSKPLSFLHANMFNRNSLPEIN